MAREHQAVGSVLPRRIYVVGAGGHGREIAWLVRDASKGRTEVVFAVDDPQFLADSVEGVPVRLLSDVEPVDQAAYVIAVGDSRVRRRLAAACEDKGLNPVNLAHPSAIMSEHVILAPGSVVCAGAILTVNVSVGRHAHINIGCSISHDCRIGEFATLAPGVRVAGNVHIGRDAFLGIGSTIANGTHSSPLIIGEGAIIAAGACVTKPVEAGSLVAGVPAIRKR